MISVDLRIRLEGRVEELEGELQELEVALRAAKRLDFEPAEKVLSRATAQLPNHDDQGLKALQRRRELLRGELARCVSARLRQIGMPETEPARGAHWINAEPVLYEHHRLAPTVFARVPVAVAGLVVFPTLVTRIFHLPLLGFAFGASLFAWGLSRSWTDVVLTKRRAVIEGAVVELENLARVALIRPPFQTAPLRWKLELHYSNRPRPVVVSLRYAPTKLRDKLQKLGIRTGNDWGPT